MEEVLPFLKRNWQRNFIGTIGRWFIVAAVLSVAVNCSKPVTVHPWSIELESLDGQLFALAQLARHRASVILFLQPECPFCHTYARTFLHIDSLLRSKDIALVAVVAGTNFPKHEIEQYRTRYKFNFPILLDPDFSLTQALKASITPQVFLLNPKGEKIYHGQIDNWGYEIGKVRARPTEFYLLEAVEAFLAGKPQPRDSTQAVGCYIQ